MELELVYHESHIPANKSWERVHVTAYEPTTYAISLIHIEHIDTASEQRITDCWETTTSTGAKLIREAIKIFDDKIIEVGQQYA